MVKYVLNPHLFFILIEVLSLLWPWEDYNFKIGPKLKVVLCLSFLIAYLMGRNIASDKQWVEALYSLQSPNHNLHVRRPAPHVQSTWRYLGEKLYFWQNWNYLITMGQTGKILFWANVKWHPKKTQFRWTNLDPFRQWASWTPNGSALL